MPEEQIAGEGEAREQRRRGRTGPSDGVAALRRCRIQAHSAGSASATRQNALANGPTSARRTKIGEMPIASAPATSAAKGAPSRPAASPRGRLASLVFDSRARSGRWRWRRAAPSLFSPQATGKGAAWTRGRGAKQARPTATFAPFEQIAGALDGGALVICDHAANALPPRYGDLGLPREALERHIAYDIGAAWLARRLAEQARRAGGALDLLAAADRPQPRRRRPDAGDARFPTATSCPATRGSTRRKSSAAAASIGRPTARRSRRRSQAMLASGEPPAILSIHSFTPHWRGQPRPWKVGVLWDSDPRLPAPLIRALARGARHRPRRGRRQRALRRRAARRHDQRDRHRARPRQRADRGAPGSDRRTRRRGSLGRPAGANRRAARRAARRPGRRRTGAAAPRAARAPRPPA